jgi:peroxiredoxin
LRHDYPKIRRAGAELLMVGPDPLEEHRRYGLALFGAELPYLLVPDSTLEIARRYGLLREEEHPHGGYYYLSLWIVDAEGVIVHKSLPWKAVREVEEYLLLFTLIGSEPGEWIPMCGLEKGEDGEFRKTVSSESVERNHR